jgi:hypothetical protein
MLEGSDGKAKFLERAGLLVDDLCDSHGARMPDQNPLDPALLGPSVGAGAPRLYVNAIAIRGGAFDVTLDLGYSVPPVSQDQPPEAPEWLARVSMSWEHATALARFLEEAIKTYEEQAGKLPDIEKIRAQVQP